VHVVELNVPELSEVKLTVPVGVVAVPRLVSVTVTVHVVASFTAIEDGEHVTVAEVVRFVAVIPKLEAVLTK
jgi:hypothetical protein